jgi:hypothetical protein
LAVPSNTSIRDLEVEPPPYGGHGHRPKMPFRGVRAWCEALPIDAWTKLTVRDGEKGPLEVEVVARRVESKINRRAGRGKKGDAGVDGAAGAGWASVDLAPGEPMRHAEPCGAGADAPA